MRRNNSPCPPAPNYAREMGVSDCQFLQLSKRQQNDYRTHYLEKPLSLPKNAYLSLGGTPMHHRRNPFGLGRAVLEADKFKMKTLRSLNRRFSKSYPVTLLGNYEGFSPIFIEDLWRAQAGIFWLSDGNAYAGQFPSMRNFVSSNGGDPDSLPEHFVATMFDFRDVLPEYKGGQYGIYGPDGIWGPASEQLISAFIADPEDVFGVNVLEHQTLFDVFSRLVKDVSSPTIAATTPNSPVPPSLVSDCSVLSGNAQEAAGDCVATKTSLKEGGEIKTKRKGGLYGSGGGERNWWVLGGVATAGILLNYHLYRKRLG